MFYEIQRISQRTDDKTEGQIMNHGKQWHREPLPQDRIVQWTGKQSMEYKMVS